MRVGYVALRPILMLLAFAAVADEPGPAQRPGARTTNPSGRGPLSIQSATAQTFYCTQPDPRQDACYINVAYTSGTGANATDFGFLHMSIDGKIVLRAQGFFQQTLSTDYTFAGLGFRVQCGPPVDDPTDPAALKRKIGNAYNVDLKWNGVGTSWDLADLMTVYCPPYDSTQGAAVISVSPASLASTQAPGTTSASTLSISDTAQFPLWWNLLPSLSPGCSAGSVSWLSVSTAVGTTQPHLSEPVDVTFNSTGLAPGHYAAHVCVQSGDTYAPQIDVPVALTVTCPVGGPLAISASPTVGAGSPGRVASVRQNAGSTFTWTITNGTITAGQGTNAVTFTAGTPGTPVGLGVTETNPDPAICVGAAGTASIPVLPAGSSLLFFPVTPCRLADTRLATGPLGGPALAASEVRSLKAAGSCNVPAGALGVSMNVTVTQPTTSGFLAVYPGTATYLGTSTLSFRPGQTRADAAVIGLATDGAGTFRVLNGSAGSAHVVIDVNGYFY